MEWEMLQREREEEVSSIASKPSRVAICELRVSASSSSKANGESKQRAKLWRALLLHCRLCNADLSTAAVAFPIALHANAWRVVCESRTVRNLAVFVRQKSAPFSTWQRNLRCLKAAAVAAPQQLP